MECSSIDSVSEYLTTTVISADSLSELIDDVIDIITEYMDVDTYSIFRQVYRISWKVKHIKEHGSNKMVHIHDRYSHYPAYGKTLSFQNVEYTTKCVQCKHSPITFIEWECGLKRRCIPWCVTHVPTHLMDSVECFCIGGDSVETLGP